VVALIAWGLVRWRKRRGQASGAPEEPPVK
jgi:hypothetical protein